MNRIKCLFGYHNYDEVWLVRKDTLNDPALLKVCSNCRTMAQYSWNSVDNDPWQMKILEENISFFDVLTPVDSAYRFAKRNQNQLLMGPMLVHLDQEHYIVGSK